MSASHLTQVILAAGVLLLPSAHGVETASAQQQTTAAQGDTGSTARAVAQPTRNTAPQAANEGQSGGEAPRSGGGEQTASSEAQVQAGAEKTQSLSLPYLESDEQNFDIANRKMTASGNVVLRHDNIFLQSNAVHFHQEDKRIAAEGDVVLSSNAVRFIAPEASYAHETGQINSRDFRLGTYPLRATGEALHGTANNLETTNTTVYFTEPDPFSLNLGAGSVRIENQQQLYLEDVVFRLGTVPFFYVPGYSFGLQSDVPASFNFRVGYSRSMGAYLQTQTLIRLMEGLQLGANLDGYTARGVLVGPAGKINTKWGDHSFIDSTFTSGYINDNGGSDKLGLDMLGRPIDRNRFFIDWDLLAGIGKQIDITGTLNWWSDSEVTRDYREDLFNHNQTPDNYLSGTYRGENYLGSVFMRYVPNAWEQSAQRLPEVSFNLVPTQIFETGIYQRLEASYANLREKDPLGVFEQLESSRFNAYYSLTRTFGYSDWATITPVAGVMATHYAKTAPGSQQSTYTRVLGEVGFDAQMLIRGQWDVQNKTWGINGLRHQMRPVLQYRYIPAAQSGDTLIPQIDRQSAFQTYLDPIGLANRRSIDDLYASSTLRIGLENVLQTRSDTDYGSRQLLALNFYQQFNFIREPATPARFNDPARPRQDTFSDFFTQLSVTPTNWLNMEVFSRIDPNSFQMRQISTRTRVIDTDQWSAYVGNDYLEDNPGEMINQYVLGGAYRINDRNQVSIDLRIDGALSEVTEQYYGWQTMLGNSWVITTQVGYLTGTDRNNHFQFRIRADLKLF